MGTGRVAAGARTILDLLAPPVDADLIFTPDRQSDRANVMKVETAIPDRRGGIRVSSYGRLELSADGTTFAVDHEPRQLGLAVLLIVLTLMLIALTVDALVRSGRRED
jgi:hypothetical protein